MQLDARSMLMIATPICALVAIIVATLGTSLPPADFTFANGTEVKSFDPAIVTGQPEGRILNCLFERLVNWHPQTLEPIPGVAESWEISDDGLVYTRHCRGFQLFDTTIHRPPHRGRIRHVGLAHQERPPI